MLQRTIYSSGEKIPLIGIGSWLQFDVGTASREREPLSAVLEQMVEKGGKLIDSSPMYGNAEQVIGDLTSASGFADELFYATKVWTTGELNGIHQMESSMKKMKRNTIDLIQIHNLQDWKTHLKTLNKWKADGKVRYTGVTHYQASAHAELERIVTSKVVDFVQFNYSILQRNAERSLLKASLDSGVSVIVNEPFEKGHLFRLVKGMTVPPWAKENGINTWSQFFLKYIIAHPAVTCVIPGTSDVKHVADNMDAGYGKLPGEKELKRMVDFIQRL